MEEKLYESCKAALAYTGFTLVYGTLCYKFPEARVILVPTTLFFTSLAGAELKDLMKPKNNSLDDQFD
jgi:hypothetical protein